MADNNTVTAMDVYCDNCKRNVGARIHSSEYKNKYVFYKKWIKALIIISSILAVFTLIFMCIPESKILDNMIKEGYTYVDSTNVREFKWSNVGSGLFALAISLGFLWLNYNKLKNHNCNPHYGVYCPICNSLIQMEYNEKTDQWRQVSKNNSSSSEVKSEAKVEQAVEAKPESKEESKSETKSESKEKSKKDKSKDW